MGLGRSKISDMNPDEFNKELEEGMEAEDMARMLYQAQRESRKERESLDKATGALEDLIVALNASVTNTTNAVKAIKGLTVKATIDPKDWEKLDGYSKTLLEGERKLLGQHTIVLRNIIESRYEEMAKTIREHDGVCLSHSACKTLLWIFIPSLMYTVASLTWLLVRFFGS